MFYKFVTNESFIILMVVFLIEPWCPLVHQVAASYDRARQREHWNAIRPDAYTQMSYTQMS